MVYSFRRGYIFAVWFNRDCYRSISSSSLRSMKVIFFGTDVFSIGTLKALNKIRLCGGTISNIDVISSGKTRYIKKEKRFCIPPVLDYADNHNLKTISWETVKKEKRFDKDYDLGVVASFGDFIPGKLLSMISRGAINIHPSLLPRWRGAAPIIHTILAGDSSTGVSVIEVSKRRFDVGKILYQEEYKVPELCTGEELLHYLSEKSGEMIPHVIENIEELQRNATVQCESRATHAAKVDKCTGYINLSKHTVDYLQRLQRALPTKIGIRVSWDNKEVKLGQIMDVMYNSSNNDGLPPGSCWYDKENRSIWLKVQDGSISFDTVQFEYKKEISAASFYNGYIIDRRTGLPGFTVFNGIT